MAKTVSFICASCSQNLHNMKAWAVLRQFVSAYHVCQENQISLGQAWVACSGCLPFAYPSPMLTGSYTSESWNLGWEQGGWEVPSPRLWLHLLNTEKGSEAFRETQGLRAVFANLESKITDFARLKCTPGKVSFKKAAYLLDLAKCSSFSFPQQLSCHSKNIVYVSVSPTKGRDRSLFILSLQCPVQLPAHSRSSINISQS